MITFTPTGDKKRNGEGVEHGIQPAPGTLKPLTRLAQIEQQWISRFTIKKGASDTSQDI